MRFQHVRALSVLVLEPASPRSASCRCRLAPTSRTAPCLPWSARRRTQIDLLRSRRRVRSFRGSPPKTTRHFYVLYTLLSKLVASSVHFRRFGVSIFCRSRVRRCVYSF
ncbi:hypothetical protein TGP89_215425 [Toxoplasma gondii p89]|uniref:Uncharacterized protein n=1 Tax=Toxoplasma gondii p89 TaxID=943119 RepID=A0A086KAE4_TOXGO|nr:hypothetical protein TGP89_215425 [Toxoplasma gondii p89]